MTQEEKQLLLRDLCARFPYGVMMKVTHDGVEYDIKFNTELLDVLPDFADEFKPYLRPMSSMTEEECITLSKLIPYETDAWKHIKTPIPLYIANIEQFDFFHRHHLDWRGLIQKGLALEAPEGMYEIG